MNDIAADYGAAFARLASVDPDDKDEVRRAMRDLFANLYAWRELEVHHLGKAEYRAQASQSVGGRTAEALNVLRAVDQHHLDQLVVPKRMPLYPGEGLYPSEFLYPGSNLCFVEMRDLPARVHGDSQADQVETYLAGMPVLPAADRAGKFYAGLAEP